MAVSMEITSRELWPQALQLFTELPLLSVFSLQFCSPLLPFLKMSGTFLQETFKSFKYLPDFQALEERLRELT